MNKRPMGYITHLRKNSKQKNKFERSYNYTSRLVKGFQYYLLLERGTNKNLLYPRMICAKFSLNRPSGSGILKIHLCLLPILLLSPLCNHLNNLEFHSPKDALPQGQFKFAPWFWRRKIFEFLQCSGEEDFYVSAMYFCYFAIISLKRGKALQLNILGSP